MLRFLVPRVTEDVQLQRVINERAAERPLRTGKFSFITVAPTSPFSHRYPLALLAGQPEGQVCGGVLEPQQELHWAEIAVWFKMSTFVDSQGLGAEGAVWRADHKPWPAKVADRCSRSQGS